MKARVPYQMSKNEEKAMNDVINQQIAKNMCELERNIEACVLYAVRKKYGSGKKKLLEFHEEFRNVFDDLIKRYEMGNEDTVWLCKEKLKEIGVDVDEFEYTTDKNPAGLQG